MKALKVGQLNGVTFAYLHGYLSQKNVDCI